MLICNITLNYNGAGAFYSGQEVSGTVMMRNDKRRKYKTLKMKVTGVSCVTWVSRIQNFFKIELDLDRCDTERQLLAGDSSYNFSFMLPREIPSAMKGIDGEIFYEIEVSLDQKVFPLKAINVFTSLDLNYEGPEIRLPLKFEVTRSVFFGLSSQLLKMTIEIPYRGVVAYQTFPIRVKIINDSRIAVEEIVVKLHRLNKYQVRENHESAEKPVVKFKEIYEGLAASVPAGSTKYCVLPVKIPLVQPTCFRFSKDIRVTYEIIITAKLSGLHRNLEITFPVLVGTVPLTGFENKLPSYDSQAVSNGTADNPPSYELAVEAKLFPSKTFPVVPF